MTPRLKVPLAVLLALVLQQSLFVDMRVAGVAPDALLLVAVAAGIADGPESGALVGFFAGIALDLFLQTPFGLSALVFSVVGYAVGSVANLFVRASWWIPVATAVLAGMAGEVAFALAGGMLGETQLLSPRLATIALVVGLVNGLLAVPAVRLLRWALAGGAVPVRGL